MRFQSWEMPKGSNSPSPREQACSIGMKLAISELLTKAIQEHKEADFAEASDSPGEAMMFRSSAHGYEQSAMVLKRLVDRMSGGTKNAEQN